MVKSIGPRPILLACHRCRGWLLQSNWSTGTPNLSQRGAPSPASSNCTEANEVLHKTASTPSR